MILKGDLSELQDEYEICATQMQKCLDSRDEQGFTKWLRLSSKINREIDAVLEGMRCEDG